MKNAFILMLFMAMHFYGFAKYQITPDERALAIMNPMHPHFLSAGTKKALPSIDLAQQVVRATRTDKHRHHREATAYSKRTWGRVWLAAGGLFMASDLYATALTHPPADGFFGALGNTVDTIEKMVLSPGAFGTLMLIESSLPFRL
jgi:hypothetical protein